MARRSGQDGPSLLDLIEEASENPPLCPHAVAVKSGRGWTLERDCTSNYYGMWVDSDPSCRRPRHLSKQEGY